MVIATHIIKVRGSFNRNLWNQDTITKYVRKKIISNIDDIYHTNLELLKIDYPNENNGKIEVWVYIHGYPSQVDKDLINVWLDKNIIEEGLIIEDFEFEMIVDITKSDWKSKPFINLPDRPFDDMNKEEIELAIDKIHAKYNKIGEIDLEYQKKKEERKKEEGIRYIFHKLS